MVKVEVIATPAGQAPEWVHDAWIGVQFEAERDNPREKGVIRGGVLGGKPDKENTGGYSVNGRVAITQLGKSNPEAAEWWKKNTPFFLCGQLVFGAKFYRIVS